MMYVWLIIGFVLLVKGADFFVEGSSSVAKIFRVPTIIIGLTIVAFGTSCPEAAVSITASLENKNAMALSNVVGSNIFNLMVVTGFSAAIAGIKIDPGILKKELPMTILVTFILLGMSLLGFSVGRADGILLLIGFVAFVVYMVWSALKNRTESEEEVKVLPLPVSLLYIAGGLIAIVWGGDRVVESASDIARTFGLSETLIGLTIVSVGTSLPELVTSIVAAAKGESDLALGNVVGSNLFNILMVLGSAAAISPVTVAMESIYDMIILIAMSVCVLIMAWKDKKLNRVEGVFMIAIYAVYLAYIIMR